MILAARGLREDDEGKISRLAGEWISIVQRQAKKVWLQSLVATLALTLLFLLLGAVSRR